MKLFIRSLRNVLRNPLRLILVIALLGTSLMFVATMMSLSTSAQQELASVHKRVGTTITINYAQNDANPVQQSGASGTAGGPSSSPSFTGPTPIPNSVVAKVKRVPGVVSTQESLARPDTKAALKSGSITGPNGQQVAIPLMINGLSSDATTFTLMGGDTPRLVSGRTFRSSDANAEVAMMSQALARLNHLHVGSTFSLNGTTFTLIGLYTTSSQFSDNTLVIPLAPMQKVFGIHGVDSVTASAASYEQVESVAARVRRALGKQFDVVTHNAQYSTVFNALQVAHNSIQVALVVSFLIAAAVTVFAVLLLVRERTAEIAILKTMGASHVQVVRQFWTEIVALSAAAAALAVLLLVTLGPVISQKFDSDASALVNAGGPGLSQPVMMVNGAATNSTSSAASNPLGSVHLAAATLNVQTLLIIVGVGIGLALLTSLIPTWFVSHVKPAEVLRKANH